jgi:hypothetical protein
LPRLFFGEKMGYNINANKKGGYGK